MNVITRDAVNQFPIYPLIHLRVTDSWLHVSKSEEKLRIIRIVKLVPITPT